MDSDAFAQRLVQLAAISPLVTLPRRPTDRHVLLKAIAIEFERNAHYSETAVDDHILRWLHEVGRRVEIDHVSLRRRLVDKGYLRRTRDGGQYRLGDEDPASMGYEKPIGNLDLRAAVAEALSRREQRKREHTATREKT